MASPFAGRGMGSIGLQLKAKIDELEMSVETQLVHAHYETAAAFAAGATDEEVHAI
jgi:nitrite reductase (cytochrome c-552)